MFKYSDIPVNGGVTFFSFFPRELHIDVEIKFVFESEGVPVESLHLNDVGVAELE